MQTYLGICQDVFSELGIQSNLNSLTEAVGLEERLCKAISRRWRTLQSYREDWQFLRTEVTHTILANTQSYSVSTILGATNRFGRWDKKGMRYPGSGTQPLPICYIDYDAWSLRNMTVATGYPRLYTIQPWDNSLIFQNLTTNTDVTLTYYKSPQVLVSDGDLIECPQMHEGVLFWYGVMVGAKMFELGTAFGDARVEYEKELGSLMRSQIPSRTIVTRAIA